MESPNKIVDFEYCKKCIHKDLAPSEDPCWDCLTVSTNEGSYKPVHYQEEEKN